VCPRLRLHRAAGATLQTVVADRGGCVQALLDVAIFEELSLLTRMVTPDAGETVGLQFDADRQRVRAVGSPCALRRSTCSLMPSRFCT
jgi:hypothetical protein